MRTVGALAALALSLALAGSASAYHNVVELLVPDPGDPTHEVDPLLQGTHRAVEDAKELGADLAAASLALAAGMGPIVAQTAAGVYEATLEGYDATIALGYGCGAAEPLPKPTSGYLVGEEGMVIDVAGLLTAGLAWSGDPDPFVSSEALCRAGQAFSLYQETLDQVG